MAPAPAPAGDAAESDAAHDDAAADGPTSGTAAP
jgi:hypothetical protein